MGRKAEFSGMAQLKIFLCHSSADRQVAVQIVTALRHAGADVWYDEHNLGAGQLLGEIQRELSSRPVVLLLISKAALASKWVRREMEWAYNLYSRDPIRVILPIIVEKVAPHDFDQWLFIEDFRRIAGPGDQPLPVREIIERTTRLLELSPARSVPPQGDTTSGQGDGRHGLPPTSTWESTDELAALGAGLQSRGDYAGALEAYDRALTLNPQDGSLWNNRATVLAAQGRHADALAAYERATALIPRSLLAWRGKVYMLYLLERLEDSLDANDAALRLSPNDADTRLMRAATLFALKRYDDVLHECDVAMELESTTTPT